MSKDPQGGRRAGDVIVVSNRLPVRIVSLEDRPVFEASGGGLVTAVRAVEGLHAWIGWPGAPVPEPLQVTVRRSLARQRLHPVFLDDDEIEDFYGRICNDTLWPLFHYFVDRLRITEEAWQRYVDVNRRFAEAALRAAQGLEDPRVWVHDFHLMLVPSMLRAAQPDITVGFFLHIPFPSSEVYRLLPSREAVLRGLLGADYVSFQTPDDARHFRSACLRVLGLDSSPDAIEVDGRVIGIGIDPIGIDTRAFEAAAKEPETAAALAELEERFAGRSLVLGVERLDYTKGIPQKLRAFERFLERDPERALTSTLLQVLVPSRLESPEVQSQRDEIERMVSGINGRFGRPGVTPVEYLHRSISRAELVAFYRRADVMLVTSLRDGMNLVAQEFAYTQSVPGLERRWNGALLLSELAGAANVLAGAVLVNPWHVGGIADKLEEALAFDAAERQRRLLTMSERVRELDSRRWARRFLDRLQVYARRRARMPRATLLSTEGRHALARSVGEARRRTLLLDYDGTLRELVTHPELAAPTPEIIDLLGDLATLPATEVHLVSGRDRNSLERWFHDVPIWLCAEHGFAVQAPGESWTELVDVDLSWLPRFERLLSSVAAEVPGTMVERKACSVAWHYRQAEPEYGSWRARELLMSIEQLLPGVPAEILVGHRVVEVRARGVSKGGYVARLFPRGRDRRHAVLAIGDDLTDQEMYAALPAGAVSVHVGTRRPTGPSRHQHLIPEPATARALLREIVVETLRKVGVEAAS
jgi:trehalose 6-phosphate synthase/phosphatase